MELPTFSSVMAKPAPPTPIHIRRQDLPLSCPRPDEEVWNMHPRVYLALDAQGSVTCPYCGATYQLVDD